MRELFLPGVARREATRGHGTPRFYAALRRVASASVALSFAAGCGSNGSQPWDTSTVSDGGGGYDATGGAGGGGGASSGGTVLPPADDGGGGSLVGDVNVAEIGPATTTADPQTCDEA